MFFRQNAPQKGSSVSKDGNGDTKPPKQPSKPDKT